jgi:hypothetical protein
MSRRELAALEPMGYRRHLQPIDTASRSFAEPKEPPMSAEAAPHGEQCQGVGDRFVGIDYFRWFPRIAEISLISCLLLADTD